MIGPSPGFSKLLVCDDDTPFRQRLARSLRGQGFVVFEADSAASGIEAAREYSPDAIVVDMRMPGESGLWFVQELRKFLPAARVLVLTGFGSISTALDAIRLGATNYLTKPATLGKILEAFFPEKGLPATSAELPSLAEVEQEYVNRVLEEHEGNVSQAAKALGVHRRSLQRKLRREP